jgi:hypothetical protein
MEEYYTFTSPDFISKCEFVDTLTGKNIDPTNYINLNKRYKLIDWARDPQSPYYDKYIPYYVSAPILECENNKIITVTFMIEDFYDDEVTTIHDDIGVCELENIKTPPNWYKYEGIDLSENRNEKINKILEIEDIKQEKKIEDLF